MNNLNIFEFAIFISLMRSLLPKDLTNQILFIVIAADVCRVAAVKCRPLHHYSADYIVWSFGTISYLKTEFHLSRCYGAWPVLQI